MTYCTLRVGSWFFNPYTGFRTAHTSNLHGTRHVGPSVILPEVGLIWGIKWDVFIFICVALYTFEKCNKSMDGRTTDRFIAILAVGRDVIESMNSTCIQLCIPSILCPFLRTYVHISPVHFTCSFILNNHLRNRFISKFILLRHVYVGYSNISFRERLSFNTFSHTFVHFTIAVLTWYDFT